MGDSVVLEKLVAGPTSSPRQWHIRSFKKTAKDEWYAAQQLIWDSPQTYKEFAGSRLGVLLGRTLFLNCAIALVLFAYAHFSSNWHSHINLILGIVSFGLFFALTSWWISTGDYQAIIRVAGDIEKKKADAVKESPASLKTEGADANQSHLSRLRPT